MSPSSDDPATVVRRQRPRGVRRLPNELLREMVQCVPMGWFVGSQAEQHRHGTAQLGIVLGTYLGQAGTKFAAMAKRLFRMALNAEINNDIGKYEHLLQTTENEDDRARIRRILTNLRSELQQSSQQAAQQQQQPLHFAADAQADEQIQPVPAPPDAVDPTCTLRVKTLVGYKVFSPSVHETIGQVKMTLEQQTGIATAQQNLWCLPIAGSKRRLRLNDDDRLLSSYHHGRLFLPNQTYKLEMKQANQSCWYV